MFTGRATSEILTRDEDLRCVPRLLIEDEVGFQRHAVVLVPQFEKSSNPKPCALDGFQKVLRDDAVCVYVRLAQRSCDHICQASELRSTATGNGKGSTSINDTPGSRWRHFDDFLEVSLGVTWRSWCCDTRLARLPRQLPHVGQFARHRGGRRHGGAQKVGAAPSPLTALEVPVRGRGTTLLRQQHVRIHAEAHGTARLAPVETGLLEDHVETLRLRLLLDPARPWDDHRVDAVGDLPSLDDGAHGAQVLDAAVRAGSDEHLVDGNVLHTLPGLQTHVLERLLHAGSFRGVLHGRGIGHDACDGHHILGTRAPGHRGRDLLGVDEELLVVRSTGVGSQRSPVRHGRLPVAPLGREGAALEILEGRLIWCDDASARAGLDGHVANGHPRFHGQSLDGASTEFNDAPGPSCCADTPNDVENNVLRGHAFGQSTRHLHPHVPGLFLLNGLCGQHVLHLRRADAKSKSTKGSMRGGVAVTTHQGGARKSEPLFRPHDVNNSLPLVIQAKVLQPELGYVLLESHDLSSGVLFGDEGLHILEILAVVRGDVVVHRHKSTIWPTDSAVRQTKAFEGLWTGDLVHEVPVHVYQ
mmetsp:Transcript_63960/g.169297  ORF Transcript_63960/g.169297 Transcript_63960/m.169297 type:complete len:585 (-) Transcript_63960:74-1828(-)